MSTTRGTTFVELMVAMSIVGVALMVMLTQITISFRETAMNESKVFAYRKAMTILAEVQNGIERGDIQDAEALDAMADIAGNNVVLTTVADPAGETFDPAHPMSGNVQRQGQWLWSRVLEVDRLPAQERLRYVRVRVYQLREGATWDLQATVGGIVALEARAFPSEKVYDVYVLAISAAPSLWLPMAPARALLETARTELQTIDNGLRLRFHWITKLGYGRDPVYAPYVNTAIPASEAAPAVYWYPGVLDPAQGDSLYVAEYFGGRVRTDGGVLNDYHAEDNPHPHAVADQFNHCLRLPEARALFERRVDAGLEREDEPPLQILLEDMAADPERYRNAIFVNLHGSALPMPPLRNHSDAAKDPTGRPGVRVVTHPERLWTVRDPADIGGSDNALFRVYAYKTDPDVGPVVLSEPITLQVMGVDLTQDVNGGGNDRLQIKRLQGGISKDTGLASGSGRDYKDFDKAVPRPAPKPFEMCWEVGYVAAPEPHTWIKLYNTPLVTPEVGNRGLVPAERLYGMEYVPSPVKREGFTDLHDSGVVPKNTARWQISLPKKLFDEARAGGFGGNADQVVTVVTRIGDDMTTGATWPTPHQPHNVSRTYTWWTASPLAVPVTERYQFQGDPRHNPYIDLVDQGESFPHGYNWHFDDLRESLEDATARWPCLDANRLQDGFGAGHVADAPRLLQLLRGSLQSCGGVFVNPCGVSGYALLLGGEIGMPGPTADVSPSPVLMHGDLVGASDPVLIDSISPALPSSTTQAGRHVVLGSGADPFWAMEWLGELYPDAAQGEYLATGNLGTAGFHREPRAEAVLPRLPAGTDFDFAVGGVLGLAGSVALVDSGTLGSTFLHVQEFESPTANLTDAARSIAEATGDPMPETMPSAWPFGAEESFAGQLPYFNYTANYPKSVAQLLERHYDGIGVLTSAGTVGVEAPTSSATAFFSVLGLSPSAPLEHEAVAMGALMLGLRSFHRGGEPSVPGRITQTPLVEILEPTEGTTVNDPSSLLLRWKTSFYRFDQDAYTTGYPSGFSEPEDDLVYAVLYSRDDGETWRNALDSQPAQEGVRPPPSLLLPDAASGNEFLALPTPPETYVGANYVFRIECYHKTRKTHLSVHQIRVLLKR